MEEILITKKVEEVITEEFLKAENKIQLQELSRIISEMKEAGFIKTPNYNLPPKDTIGKNYYLHLFPLK
jgi:transcription initiation factor IIE alpha subunit